MISEKYMPTLPMCIIIVIYYIYITMLACTKFMYIILALINYGEIKQSPVLT